MTVFLLTGLFITLGLAVTGCILGVLALHLHASRLQVQLRVHPSVVDLGTIDGRWGIDTVAIEIINLSEFPLTVRSILLKEIGLSLQPVHFLKGSVPIRLGSRGSTSVTISKKTAEDLLDLKSVHIVISTACGAEVVKKLRLGLRGEVPQPPAPPEFPNPLPIPADPEAVITNLPKEEPEPEEKPEEPEEKLEEKPEEVNPVVSMDLAEFSEEEPKKTHVGKKGNLDGLEFPATPKLKGGIRGRDK
jgi:hypothetical protein